MKYNPLLPGMGGQHIKNIYCIDGKEYLLEQLSESQLLYIQQCIKKRDPKDPFTHTNYLARFRWGLVRLYGADVEANLHIYFPAHTLEAYSPDGKLLMDESHESLKEIQMFNYKKDRNESNSI